MRQKQTKVECFGPFRRPQRVEPRWRHMASMQTTRDCILFKLDAPATDGQATRLSVERELPVREVKPGVFVALFNPLGDHELNEALGASLAPKIPAGAQVLLMPDGKAQALLHVLGRISRLPTVVAKKEVKSYMKQPVVAGARDECMTSAGREAFYLGADQAQLLAVCACVKERESAREGEGGE